jgi:enoyl-[acyl-carrier protein] reductase I
MGVAKAGLEAANRYVARDLGARRIRANLVAAGPIHTRAAGGIPEFATLTDAWEERSPLPWDPTDSAPVADAVVFLLSNGARMISGEILHVDGGYHAMAAPLVSPPGRPTPLAG